MPFQPAILGLATVGNTPLGYIESALTDIRQTRVVITVAGSVMRYRRGSVTIRDVINDSPNTAALIINSDTPPTQSQRIRITINSDIPRLLFSGALETITETYDLKPEQVAYHCTAQDDTPRANRRIPLAYYEDTPADEVAIDLVANFAPGFTANGVQAGMPEITVHFEGSEAGMNGCLRQIAKLIGGYFYWEDRDLHLFLEEASDQPDDIDSTPGRLLDNPHITITFDDSQLRTRVFGKGHQEATLAEIAIGANTIPLGDVSMHNPAGGQVISDSQILSYTGTSAGGSGALVGTTITPTNAPTVAGLTAASGIDAGDHYWAYTFYDGTGETLPSPISATIAIGATIAAPVSAPTVQRLNGGNLSLGNYQWKLGYKTSGGGSTTPGPVSSTLTMEDFASPPTNGGTIELHDNAGGTLSTGDYKYKYTFKNGSLETLPSPATNTYTTGGNNWRLRLIKSTVDTPPAGWARQFYRTVANGSTFKKMPGSVEGFDLDFSGYLFDQNQSDASLGVDAPTNSTATYRKAQLTLPGSADANVTHIAVYRTLANGSTFYHVTDVAIGTTTYVDDTTDASLVNAAPSSNTSVIRQAALSSINPGPSGTTGRKVYRTAAGAAQLKLLTDIANNTATTHTDSAADGTLGANVPTSNTSGLVQQTGDVAAGSTSLLVTSTLPFASGGGWAFIGNLPIRYTGFSSTALTGLPTSGVGALNTTVRYGAEVIASAILTGVTGIGRALIKGAPIHIWVQRDDLAAQLELAAREGEGDGIVEHMIVDERRGYESLIALCDADLAQWSRPVVTVIGASRDVKMKSGKPLVIDLPSPFIDEELTVQEVTITELDIAPRLAPRFTFTAASVSQLRSVEDLLRRMATASLEGQ